MVSLLRKLFDPLSDFSFRTPDRVSGATVYTMTSFLHNNVAYLKTCQKAGACFGQSALNGLNPLNHRTHEDTVFLNNGNALQRFQ